MKIPFLDIFRSATKQLNPKTVSGYISGTGYTPDLPYTPRYVDEISNLINSMDRLEIMAVAQRLYFNFGEVKSIILNRASLSCQNAFIPRCTGPDENFNVGAESYFTNWCKIADIKGQLTFSQLLHQISICMDVDGECFVILTKTKSDFPALQLVRSRTCVGKDNDGIAYNREGRPVSYTFKSGTKSDPVYTTIPAQSVIHFWSPEFPDQKRGNSLVIHALEPFLRIEQLRKDESVAVALASAIGLIKKTATGEPEANVDFDVDDLQEEADGKPIVWEDIRRGSIQYLSKDEEFINFNSGARPGDQWHNFIGHLLRSACAGLRYPYELVVESDLNSSEMRAMIAQLDRAIRSRQSEMTPGVQRIWNYVIASGLASGVIPQPSDGKFWQVEWSTGRRLTIDYSRDLNAELGALEAGVTNFRELYQQRGLNEWVELEQKAKEAAYIKQLAEKYGVSPSEIAKQAIATMPTAPVLQQNRNVSVGEDDEE